MTLGILIGYVAGKPVGTVGAAWLLDRLSRGRVRPPVGWAAVIGVGTIAGIGFTVALLIASVAFRGELLEEAKIGILSAALGASALTWVVFRITEPAPETAAGAGPAGPDRDARGPGRARWTTAWTTSAGRRSRR